MCYFISLKAKNEQIKQAVPGVHSDWSDDELAELEHVPGPAFPLYPVLVNEGGKYYLKKMEWGLVSTFMDTTEKVKQYRINMLNARSDRFISDPKSVWARYRHQRCLIPVSGIFEHRHIHGWKHTIPYFVRTKERELFFLPGFYAYSGQIHPVTRDRQGTFVFMTTEANELMARIHNRTPEDPRMPLFLFPETELRWLDRDTPDPLLIEIANTHFPAENLESWPVYTLPKNKGAKTARPDGKGVSAPYHWPSLPELGNDRPVEQGSLF